MVSPQDASQPLRIVGSITNAAEVLDDEFIKSLQHLDPHTSEYVVRCVMNFLAFVSDPSYTLVQAAR